jgi:hypothetical protein
MLAVAPGGFEEESGASAAYLELHGIQTALDVAVNRLLETHPLPADPFQTLVRRFWT